MVLMTSSDRRHKQLCLCCLSELQLLLIFWEYRNWKRLSLVLMLTISMPFFFFQVWHTSCANRCVSLFTATSLPPTLSSVSWLLTFSTWLPSTSEIFWTLYWWLFGVFKRWQLSRSFSITKRHVSAGPAPKGFGPEGGGGVGRTSQLGPQRSAQPNRKFIQTVFIIFVSRLHYNSETVECIKLQDLASFFFKNFPREHAPGPPIVHSKRIPEVYLNFFQMFWKIFQFSLFQCLKDAFVLLTFQFQMCSTLGKQLSIFRAKISGFAFSPTSKPSLQVCAVHIPFPRAARKGQSPMTLHLYLHWCDADRTRAKNPDMCWYKRRYLNFFFLSKQTCFFESAPPLSIWKRVSIWRRASGFRRSSLPRFVTVVDREDWCFWNQ